MKPIDLIFLAFGRLEFTLESYGALMANTNPHLVRNLYIYADGPLAPIGVKAWNVWKNRGLIEKIRIVDERLGGPVAILNHYLRNFSRPGCDLVKIDNDLIVPPSWLSNLVATAAQNTDFDLIGVEPWAPELDELLPPIALEAFEAQRALVTIPNLVEHRHIGGIGYMRRAAFRCPDCDGKQLHEVETCGNCKGSRLDLPIPARDGRFGFTEWQWNRDDLKKGFLYPAGPYFLLDHLPIEPFLTLSKRYVAEGLQRQPWDVYPESCSRLWAWWKPKF